MQLRFPSIGRAATTGYVYDTEAWTANNGGILAQEILQYDTMGDGMTAHTPNYPVRIEHAADYLLSFAEYLLSVTDLEEIKRIYSGVHYRLRFDEWHRESLAFAHSVRYVEYGEDVPYNKRKTHYYSRELKKVSTAEKLKHDRRWEEVPRWADGGVKAMVGLLSGDRFTYWLERIWLYEQCYQFKRSLGEWSDSVEELLEIPESARPYLNTALHSVRSVFKGWELLDAARRGASNYRINLPLEKTEEAA